MQTIYLLTSSMFSRSGPPTWIVRAYVNKAKAQQVLNELKFISEQIRGCPDEEDKQHDLVDALFAKGLEIDPAYQTIHEYDIVEVDMDTSDAER